MAFPIGISMATSDCPASTFAVSILAVGSGTLSARSAPSAAASYLRTRGARPARLQEAMVAGGLDAPIREDIRDEIWLKLCGNLCFNPISALTLATIDII